MSAEVNRRVIEDLYDRFAAHDGSAMSGAYAPDAVFSDPVFGELRGSQIGSMWRMLLERADDLVVQAQDIQADDHGGSANWVAEYSFGSPRRPVRNEVSARFEIADRLIRVHADEFSFSRWARQALGIRGLLLGKTPLLRNSVRSKVHSQLARYSERSG